MKRRASLILAIVMVCSLCASGQEDIKAKHAAYYLCINNIEIKPTDAYIHCSNYLKKYPNDDARLVEFASMFTNSFEKIDAYLKSVPDGDFTKGAEWSIYKPDLEKMIPWVNEGEGPHKIEISREYASPDEEKLLNKAEAVYRKREDLAARFYKQWRYFSQPTIDLPRGEPNWWTGSVDTILSAELVTTSAVIYYYDISLLFRSNSNKVKENSFAFSSTNLKYLASIKRMATYSRSGKTFKDVYIADMNLTWGQVCGGLCGHGFTRNKVVVLKPSGEVLDVFLDDPVNNTSWVS
jgi:hypothetical protein